MAGLVANINPSTINSTLVKSFVLGTIDINGDPVTENGYIVTGPTVIGSTAISIGTQYTYNKFVIALEGGQNSTYFLKFWIPFVGNQVFMTYAKKATNYADGYKDITSTNDADLPTLKTKVRSWVVLPSTTIISSVTYNKFVNFNFRGADTNQIQNSETFSINFQVTPTPPPPVPQNPGNPQQGGQINNGGQIGSI